MVTGSLGRLSVLAGLLPLVALGSWHITLVDNVSENTGTAIRVGPGDVVHVAYYSSVGLKYARHDTSGWFVASLDDWTGPHNRGPAVALDSLGRPLVAYYRGAPWLARWTGSEWQHEQVDVDSGGDYISLALDSTGLPRVAYNKGGGLVGSLLKYAWRDGSGWHPEVVDASNSGYDCVLGLGPDGRAAIADCQSWSAGALYWRIMTDTGWTRTTLVADGASQSFLSFGRGGVPHISYYATGGGDYDLRLVWRDGETWRHDTVDPGRQQTKRGWDNSIAVDRCGTCHISYHAHNERELRYAWGRPGNWTVEVVDTVGMWNLTSSLALDAGGRPWVAYCDEDENNALYVAVRDQPVGIGQAMTDEPGTRRPGPSIVRGALFLYMTFDSRHSQLLDATGRKVLDLAPGPNDVRHLSPGVYFIQAQGSRVPGYEVSSARVVVVR